MLADVSHEHATLHAGDRQWPWCLRKPVRATLREFARGARQRRDREAHELGYVELGGEA